jgi:hypothetical protein
VAADTLVTQEARDRCRCALGSLRVKLDTGTADPEASRCQVPVGGNCRLGLSCMAAMLVALAAACTSPTPPHAATGHGRPSAPGAAAAPAKVSALKREGLVAPSTYVQACSNGAMNCLHVPAGLIPAALKRPLHFPVLRTGQRCPASRGTPFSTPDFGGMALGTGPVRVLIVSRGNLRHGTADLINPTSSPPWLALKTLWFSLPAYQGPFVIRAKRLGRPGPAALGDVTGGPVAVPLVVPPGPTINSFGGYRTSPGGLWVRTPGCYAWQVDGLTFSEIIVVHAVLR